MDTDAWYEKLMDDVDAAMLEEAETPQCLQRYADKYDGVNDRAEVVEGSRHSATRYVGRENKPGWQPDCPYGVDSDYETCDVETRVCEIDACKFSVVVALTGIRRNMIEPATQLGDCLFDARQ